MTYARQSRVVFKLRALLEHLVHFYLLLTVKKDVLYGFPLTFLFRNAWFL